MTFKAPAINKMPQPRKNLLQLIDAVIRREEVWKKLEKYYANGVVTGHKIMDLGEIADIVLEADEKVNGGAIKQMKGLLKITLGHKINTAIRRDFKLDTRYRISGFSKKFMDDPTRAEWAINYLKSLENDTPPPSGDGDESSSSSTDSTSE